jgi:crotonobetainyl-CoA:carnitine CoA-transferase CaiB-like acyl-CoA transferase
MLLGDMGAEVIKVDQPIKPDTPRWGGGWLPVGEENKREAASNALQRNKKSIAIDLSAEKGRSIFYRLAKEADVILECYRPGVVKRLQIDYETINRSNPGIVYCSMSGYGQSGPYVNLPGHDINYISIAGVLGLIGENSDRPVIPLNLIGDFAGGALHAALGIMLALMARQKTGNGQYIDISITDGSISLISYIFARYFANGSVPRRGKTLLAGIAPMYNTYETKDKRYISIGCMEPWLWDNLCKALKREDLVSQGWDETKWPAMIGEFNAIFQTRTQDEWFEELSKRNISIAKVLDLDEVASDPQIKHREMVLNIDHDKFGIISQPGIAIKLSQTPGEVRSFGPILGEHTNEIMTGLGYDALQLGQLHSEGIIA